MMTRFLLKAQNARLKTVYARPMDCMSAFTVAGAVLVERARSFGGEVVKIVTTATSEADNTTVHALYKDAAPGSLIAFCMGDAGRTSRLDALRCGAPFTYACLSEEPAVPGCTSESICKNCSSRAI